MLATQARSSSRRTLSSSVPRIQTRSPAAAGTTKALAQASSPASASKTAGEAARRAIPGGGGGVASGDGAPPSTRRGAPVVASTSARNVTSGRAARMAPRPKSASSGASGETNGAPRRYGRRAGAGAPCPGAA